MHTACMHDTRLPEQRLCTQQTSLETMDAGKDRVRVDFHLCYAEVRSSFWSNTTGQRYCKKETTVLLLDLVYFFWYEERQLSRGAKMLAKVLSLPMFVSCCLPSTAARNLCGDHGRWQPPHGIGHALSRSISHCAQAKALAAGSPPTGRPRKDATIRNRSHWTSPRI